MQFLFKIVSERYDKLQNDMLNSLLLSGVAVHLHSLQCGRAPRSGGPLHSDRSEAYFVSQSYFKPRIIIIIFNATLWSPHIIKIIIISNNGLIINIILLINIIVIISLLKLSRKTKLKLHLSSSTYCITCDRQICGRTDVTNIFITKHNFLVKNNFSHRSDRMINLRL